MLHRSFIGLAKRFCWLAGALLAMFFILPTTPGNAASVVLAWDDSGQTIEGYRVFLRFEGKTYDYHVPAWQGTAKTCSLTGLQEDTVYYFTVRSYKGAQESGNSNEVRHKTPALQPPTDTDTDGISDADEIGIYRTDPNNPDTDGDGFSDGAEVAAGTDPNDATSHPGSGDPTAGAETIIDNGDVGTAAAGNWLLSGGASYYGSKSVYSNRAGDTYTFEAPAVGIYDVALWWTSYTNRCSDVPVEIYDAEQLLDTVHVDQLINGGRWNVVKNYHFTGTARIVVLSVGGCTTSADAVKLVFEGPSQETIMDNGAGGTTATGSWLLSGGASYYGSKSVYSNRAGDTYTFETPAIGIHDVALWWTAYSNRCSSVPVGIYDAGQLLDTVYVDQLKNGGQWNGLKGYNFTGTARIVVLSEGGCTTSADAVKLVFEGLRHETIVDNGGTGTTATGSWLLSGGAAYYGSKSVYSNRAGDTYTFETPAIGIHHVSLWWTSYSTRCSSVPVEIYDAGRLLDTVSVDQLKSGGQWNGLKSYSFTGTARIVVRSEGSCTTSADAVKLSSGNY